MKWIEKIDASLGVLYKYEIHAFVLLLSGVVLCLKGQKDVGFSIVTSACVIFKGKFQG